MARESRLAAHPISSRVAAVPGSKIREMFALANEVGGDLVRLEVGEPDFDTPANVTEYAFEQALAGATHYTPTVGILPLREAIAGKFAARSGVSIDPASEVAVCNGAMEAVLLGLYVATDVGEEIIAPSPSWPNYEAMATLIGCSYTAVPLDEDDAFDLDPERIIGAIDDDTAAVVLNSPCNPTGRVYDAEAVAAIVEAAASHGAYVIADEIYEGLVYDREFVAAAAAAPDADNLLTVNGCSKMYAMTGWRLGWLIGPSPVIEAAGRLHQATTSCPSSVAQHAAIEAITGDQTAFMAMYDAFHERRDYVVDRVAAIDGVRCHRPQGTFYAFLDVSDVETDSFDLATRLVHDYGVVTAPGVGFGAGGEGHLRISFANSLDQLELGLDRIEQMAADNLG